MFLERAGKHIHKVVPCSIFEQLKQKLKSQPYDTQCSRILTNLSKEVSSLPPSSGEPLRELVSKSLLQVIQKAPAFPSEQVIRGNGYFSYYVEEAHLIPIMDLVRLCLQTRDSQQCALKEVFDKMRRDIHKIRPKLGPLDYYRPLTRLIHDLLQSTPDITEFETACFRAFFRTAAKIILDRPSEFGYKECGEMTRILRDAGGISALKEMYVYSSQG